MIVFDANALICLLDEDANAPLDPATKQPVPRFRDRIQFLLGRLEEERQHAIVPTPALAELLVRADAARADFMRILSTKAPFRIADFDRRAALELSIIEAQAIEDGDKRAGLTATWVKIKFDRQILAIARIAQADEILSDDSDLQALAKPYGISVISTADLPLPPEDPQVALDLGEPPLPES